LLEVSAGTVENTHHLNCSTIKNRKEHAFRHRQVKGKVRLKQQKLSGSQKDAFGFTAGFLK